MADAAAEVLDHAGDESFTLTFNQIVSRVKLIRAGGEEEAINRPLRTMDRSKYEKIPKKRRKRVDFFVETEPNGEKYILPPEPDEHFGLSIYSSEDALPPFFEQDPKWQLDIKTPFPEELTIFYEEERRHAMIAPTRKVKVTQLTNMLKCLPWKKMQ